MKTISINNSEMFRCKDLRSGIGKAKSREILFLKMGEITFFKKMVMVIVQ